MKQKRKKNTRQRGSKTHGWGSMKKHRGAGHRGGRGAAGSGKKGDAKKPSVWRIPKEKGFKRRTIRKATITIASLEQFQKTLEEQGVITRKGETLIADLVKAGYGKLLGTGKATKKWEIIVEKATPTAKQKIEEAKGTIKIVGEGEA